MEVTLKAVNAPTVGRDGLPAYSEHPDGLSIRMSLRGNQATDTLPFEFVRLRLQGAIITSSGKRRSVEKFLSLTEECSRSQFAPSDPSTDSAGLCWQTTVVFDTAEKPMSIATSLSNRPLPSTRTEASSFVTKHTALHDQQLVQGYCETHCWVTADFYCNGSLVHSSRAVIEPKVRPSLLSFRSLKSSLQEQTAFTCRPPRPSFATFRKPLREETLAHIQLSKEDLIAVPSRTQDNLRCSVVSIPLHVSFCHLSSIDTASVDQAGGLPCEVEAKWITQRTFRIGLVDAQNPDQMTLTKQTVSTQLSDVVFPPAYVSSPTAGKSTTSATGSLQLILPESASLPTLSSELLDVTYKLEMKARFRLHNGMVLEGKTKTCCVLEG